MNFTDGTRRTVSATEAKQLHLVNYLTDGASDSDGSAFTKALEVARLLASHPQRCMRNDRLSMLAAVHSPSMEAAMQQEFALGIDTLNSNDFGSAVEAFVKRSKL